MAASTAVIGGVFGLIQGQYQAKVANMNAEIADQNAKRALERGGIEAEDNDFQTRALLGEQESAQAASGVSLSGKSQILTRRSARILGRRDSLNILQDADVEAYNYRTQAANFRAEAKASKISGIGSFVGGVASAGEKIATSMVGGSSSTAKSYKYTPTPLAKPTFAGSYTQNNPLLKRRLNRGQY